MNSLRKLVAYAFVKEAKTVGLQDMQTTEQQAKLPVNKQPLIIQPDNPVPGNFGKVPTVKGGITPVPKKFLYGIPGGALNLGFNTVYGKDLYDKAVTTDWKNFGKNPEDINTALDLGSGGTFLTSEAAPWLARLGGKGAVQAVKRVAGPVGWATMAFDGGRALGSEGATAMQQQSQQYLDNEYAKQNALPDMNSVKNYGKDLKREAYMQFVRPLAKSLIPPALQANPFISRWTSPSQDEGQFMANMRTGAIHMVPQAVKDINEARIWLGGLAGRTAYNRWTGANEKLQAANDEAMDNAVDREYDRAEEISDLIERDIAHYRNKYNQLQRRYYSEASAGRESGMQAAIDDRVALLRLMAGDTKDPEEREELLRQADPSYQRAAFDSVRYLNKQLR